MLTIKRKSVIMFILFFCALGFLMSGYFLYAIFSPCQRSYFPVSFVVKPGQGVNEISYNLKKTGVMCNSLVFETYLWAKRSEGKIKAGEYFFSHPVNIVQLTNILIRGQKKKERTIKILEGWRLKDIASYLEKENIVSGNDFWFFMNNYEKFIDKEEFPFLKDIPDKGNLEGFLFPDTYRIYSDSDMNAIVYKMLSNFHRKINKDLLQEIKRQNKTVFDIVVMASIIEKEVRDEKDMRLVSGIFWKRIKNNQPLESCATISYVLGENKRQYSYEDTRVNSPYNTYLNKGLPPGPICNPGFKAIYAAVYPQSSDYNYFLSKSNGETVFSKNYNEHIKNQKKYLK